MLAALAAVFSCLRLHSSSDKVFCKTVSSGGNGIAITCQPNSASCISSLNYWLAMCIVLNFSRKKLGLVIRKCSGKPNKLKFHPIFPETLKCNFVRYHLRKISPDFDEDQVGRLNADPRASALLHAVSSRKFSLHLFNQQLRESLALRLCASVFEKFRFCSDKVVLENGHEGLPCCKSAGRFTMHHIHKVSMEQSLSSMKVPSTLKPPCLSRAD